MAMTHPEFIAFAARLEAIIQNPGLFEQPREALEAQVAGLDPELNRLSAEQVIALKKHVPTPFDVAIASIRLECAAERFFDHLKLAGIFLLGVIGTYGFNRLACDFIVRRKGSAECEPTCLSINPLLPIFLGLVLVLASTLVPTASRRSLTAKMERLETQILLYQAFQRVIEEKLNTRLNRLQEEASSTALRSRR